MKKDCGPKPIYIEAGAETVVDGDGETRWAVYVKLGREIQCVGNDTGKDVEMEDPGMSPPSVVPKHQVLDDKKMLTLRRPARLTIRKKATAKKTIKKNTKEMIRISPRERRNVPVLFSPFSPCGSGFDMEK